MAESRVMDLDAIDIELGAAENESDTINLSPRTPPDNPRSGKRNKPTLNCNACVFKKTKCDRARPSCQSCTRRRSVCEYSPLANIIAATGPIRSRKSKAIARRMSGVEGMSLDTAISAGVLSSQSPSHPDLSPDLEMTASSTTSASAMRYPLERFSQDRPALFNLFGMSARHPFHNYWTDSGGIAEVLSMSPLQEEADILVQNFFDVIDPLYPIVPKDQFMAEYKQFWRTPEEEKHLCDPAQLALKFAIYATGMLYMSERPPEIRETTSEFYLSCCHQSLCISSYLNQCSLVTIQTMILICNYLIANSRVSDAWTFSGITHRQAYGLGLNRDPAVVRTDAPFWEHQLRCRLWQAIMFQDTSLSLYLQLPPATIHYEINPSSLRRQDDYTDGILAPENLEGMSSDTALNTDISYLRAMWQYAQFAQEFMCVNTSLKRPITNSPTNKTELISRFREIFENFEAPFNSYDSTRFENQPTRLVRQLISVSSNYFFALGILYMDRDDEKGVAWDVYGALEAAHEALAAFFALARLFPAQVDMWAPAQTRAYAQATMIGVILAAQAKSSHSPRDHRLMLAKSNFDRYCDLLARARGSTEFDVLRQKRMAELQILRNKITVV